MTRVNNTYLTCFITKPQDGNVNPLSNSKGFVVFVRKGKGTEKEMFKQYEKYVRKPTTDAIRSKMGFDPNDTIPDQVVS